MNVILNDTNMENVSLIQDMKRAGELCLKREGIRFDDEVEVDISFVSPVEIRELNREYREHDSETDVLSFPQFEGVEEIQNQEGYLCLGDIILCPEIAEKQAEEYNHSFRREMVYLMVHSMHHLLGYDHMNEEEKAVMREKEEAVMEELGITREKGDVDVPVKLFEMALEASERAYAPYSGFQVGAALLCSDGTIYPGVNVENSSYGAGICAERSAAVSAISGGKREFTAIAVAAKQNGQVRKSVPCGICRQFLFEFGEEMDVIYGKDKDHLTIVKLKDLLPEGFRLNEEI